MRRLIACVLSMLFACSTMPRLDAQIIAGRHRKIFSGGGGGGVANDVNCAISDATSTTHCSVSTTATDCFVVAGVYQGATPLDPASTGITFSNRWRNTSSEGRIAAIWTATGVGSGSHQVNIDDAAVNNVQLVVMTFSNCTAVDSTAAQEWVDDHFGNLTFNTMTGLGTADVCFGIAFETAASPLTSISWTGYSAQADATFATKGVASGRKTAVSTSSLPAVTMSGYGNGNLVEFCVR